MSEEHCPCGQPGVRYTGDDVLVCQACYDAIPTPTPARSEAAGGEEVPVWLFGSHNADNYLRRLWHGDRTADAELQRVANTIYDVLSAIRQDAKAYQELTATPEAIGLDRLCDAIAHVATTSLRQQLAAAEARYDQLAAATSVTNFDDKLLGGFLAVGQALIDRAARIKELEQQLAAAREDARGDFFSAISAIADAMDIATNGPNKPRHRRSLHAVAVPMNEILKAMQLCEANDAARSEPSGEDSQC